jgi:opacity protein-like surface antigen
MKRILCAALLAVVLATPAFAAKVYLKDGGVIQAKRAWRSGGKIHVLATRHTLTSFEKSEVDMKRTFPNKRRVIKRVAAVEPQTASAAPKEAAEVKKPVNEKSGVTLHSLPKLPEKSPDNLVPSSGATGTIRQQKKDMAEKIAE